MRYEVYRQGQPREYIEADNFRVQEVGRRESLMAGSTPGVAHYIFYLNAEEKYGQSISVASFTDVIAVRLVQPTAGDEVAREPVEEQRADPPAVVVDEPASVQ